MKQLKRLPKHLPPRDQNPLNKKYFKFIPKKIFQTWETNKVTPGMYDAGHTWIDKNPDWEYHFFDEDGRRNFIKDNFPKKVLAAYDTLIPGAYKADLWRYCVLYIHGGVYVDSKIVLCNKLDKLLDIDTKFTSVKERGGLKTLKGGVQVTFLCSMPKHPFLKRAIDLIIENINSGYFGENAICPTGPLAMGKAINLVLGRQERHNFTVGKQKIGEFEFTLWFFSTKSTLFKPRAIHIVFTNRNMEVECLQLGYSSYRKERAGLAKKVDKKYDYGYCWENLEIYDSISVDREKILYPVISQVKKAYKKKNYKKARKLIKERFFKYKQFKLVLFRCLVQYEILMPILRVLRIAK